MKKIVRLRFPSVLKLYILTIALGFLTPAFAIDLTKAALIPKPVSIKAAGGFFEINGNTAICIPEGASELMPVAQYLKSVLTPASGFNLELKSSDNSSSTNCILLKTGTSNDKLGQEGYELNISGENILLSANTAEGVFRGIQTIRQLLPAAIESPELQNANWKIPAGTITD